MPSRKHQHIGECAMSEIQGHAGIFSTSPKGDVSASPFPYDIITDYGNQLMSVIVAGQWSGQVNGESPITLAVTYDDTADQSTISFCFKLAPPGSAVGALLTYESV